MKLVWWYGGSSHGEEGYAAEEESRPWGSDKCHANSRWTFSAMPNRFDCRVDSCFLEILRAIGTQFCQIV